MLSKCSNSSCSTPFRYLHQGTLFLLKCDSEHSASTSSRGEYFWLCERCSSVMTLRLGEAETVVAVPIPEPICIVPEGVALISANRKGGLLLRSISTPSPQHLQDGVKTSRKGRHHVA
jgi:hypothetical protein